MRYLEPQPTRLLIRDEARRIAANIAKLLEFVSRETQKLPAAFSGPARGILERDRRRRRCEQPRDVRLSIRGLATARPMDQRIKSFLADVLALAGEEPDVVRDEVRVALGDYTAIFWAQEPNKLMKDKAARGCHVLCRDRVAEELERRRGTPIAEHLKLALSIIDRQQER